MSTLVGGDAGESAACSCNFVGHSSRFFAGARLANEDILCEAAGNRHGNTSDGEGRAVIAISPLASKDFVAHLKVDVRR